MSAPGATKAQLLTQLEGLASPPHTCTRVMELMQDPSTSARDFGDVIAQDPSLAARLLRLVNSSFYNLAKPVDSLTRAVSIVGMVDLQNLVVAVSAVGSFSRLQNRVVDIKSFWRHSLFTALIARGLAARRQVAAADRLFVSGLLHDVGLLLMCHRLSTTMEDMLQEARGDERRLAEIELERFGFSHAELGGEVLKRWHLPPAILAAVAYHHQPGRARDAVPEVACIHLADALAHRSPQGALFSFEDAAPAIDDHALEALDLGAEVADDASLLEEAAGRFTEVAAAIGMT